MRLVRGLCVASYTSDPTARVGTEGKRRPEHGAGGRRGDRRPTNCETTLESSADFDALGCRGSARVSEQPVDERRRELGLRNERDRGAAGHERAEIGAVE